MRKFLAIARATAFEICSEPLSLLLFMGAIALAVLAPSFHYHQFGDPLRMARDAGFSSILVFGSILAAAGVIRTLRREIESGTAAVALAHSVSRGMFLVAKAFGVMMALFWFELALVAVLMTVLKGAEIGARIAEVNGDIARLWGPSFAAAVSTLVLPCVLAAFSHRFLGRRFCADAFRLTVILALASCAYKFDLALWTRFSPGWFSVMLYPYLLLAAGAAFAVRWRLSQATMSVVVAAAVMFPLAGNYCLSDAFVADGTLGWGYPSLLAAVTAVAVAGFLLLGVALFGESDLS